VLRTLVIEYYSSTLRVGNFQQKNNSAEDGIDETNGLFRIQPVRGKENSRNSVPNHSEEEKNARNSIQWIKKRSKLSEFGIIPRKRKQLRVPFRGTKIEANFWNFLTKQRKRALSSV
jgi:hypothetical protein